MIITIFSSIIVYSYGEYWFNQFLKTEFMQSKIWEVANKEIENSAFCGIKNSYQRYETEHFIIYYKTDDLYFLQKIARAAEKIYLPTCQKMHYTKTEKTPIIILHDKNNREYNQFGGTIRITEKIVNEDKINEEEVICHEFTHVLVRDLTRANMLRWLDEGIAEYIEAQVFNKKPYSISETAEIKNYTYNVQELETNFSQIPDEQSYGQSYLTIKYIVDKYGENALFNIINNLKDERVKEETAFKRVIGLDYSQLYNEIVLYKQTELQ